MKEPRERSGAKASDSGKTVQDRIARLQLVNGSIDAHVDAQVPA